MALGTAAVLGAGFLSAAGSVYANAINSATQYKINQDNMGLQYAINMDQIEAARMNNETAIELSNTAHQREVRDLRDANLNPILSAGGNGSAVPSLDTPGLSSPTLSAPEITNPLAGITSAVQQAIAYDDQHKAYDARLAAMGFAGDKGERQAVIEAMTQRAYEEANSGAQEAIAKTEESRARYQAAKLSYWESTVGLAGLQQIVKDNGKHKDFQVNKQVADLYRDAFVSQLKDRANSNWRNNLSSASGVVDAVRKWAPLFKRSK